MKAPAKKPVDEKILWEIDDILAFTFGRQDSSKLNELTKYKKYKYLLVPKEASYVLYRGIRVPKERINDKNLGKSSWWAKGIKTATDFAKGIYGQSSTDEYSFEGETIGIVLKATFDYSSIWVVPEFWSKNFEEIIGKGEPGANSGFDEILTHGTKEFEIIKKMK